MSHIQFSLRRPSGAAYKKFIEQLRRLLSGGMKHGIQVLRHGGLDSNRFILVDLSGMGVHPPTITVAIDVETAYVVGYRVDNTSYILEQTPNQHVPINVLFPGTTRGTMGGNRPRNSRPGERPPPLRVTGEYGDLQRAFLIDYPHLREEVQGRQVRQLVSLGIVPLHEAITNLRNNEHVAEALLVIIQMVSEAARFGYIEEQVSQRVEHGGNSGADAQMISLENEWGNLSNRIHEARADGSFQPPVIIQDFNYQRIELNNVRMAIQRSTVALIHYVPEQECVPPTRAGGSRNYTGASGSRRRHEHDDL